MKHGLIIECDIGDPLGGSIQWLMKSASSTDHQEIFSGVFKVFKSVRVPCDKKTTFSRLYKGRQKVSLHLDGRSDDPAIGIRCVMTAYDDRFNSSITV